MVRDRGQTITEFLLMLALLSIIGIFLMNTMIGPQHNGGAVGGVQATSTSKIAEDAD